MRVRSVGDVRIPMRSNDASRRVAVTRSSRPVSSATHRSTTPSGPLRSRTASQRAPGRATQARRTTPGPKTKRPSRSDRTVRRDDKRPDPFIPGPNRRGRRLAVSYDLEGPRVRLGIAWFVLVFAALAVGRMLGDLPLVGLVYALVAAAAALQIVDAWTGDRPVVLRTAAGGIAAVVGLSASFGAAALGGALLGAVVVGVAVGVVQVLRRRPVLPATALVLQASLPTGLVAASVVLTMRYEIGALVILLAMVMAFDTGDFIIGSGAGSLFEGPVAGALMIILVAAVVAVIEAPPFHGALVWVFALGAIVLCPLGQVAASWLLPDATTRASALRRLDSLLVLGPLWAFGAGLVVVGT